LRFIIDSKKTEARMVGRFRSIGGPRDTDDMLRDSREVADQGSAGGNLVRKIATRDDVKRAKERRGRSTRVNKSDEPDSSINRGDE
jgi:hypothetical protein